MRALPAILLALTACKPPAQSGSTVQSLQNASAADGAKMVEGDCEGPYVNKEFWSLHRQEARASGGSGLFPAWGASREEARAELQQAGYPGRALFPNFWANRVLGP